MVRADLVESVTIFTGKSEDGEAESADVKGGSPFDRYEADLFVAQDSTPGAPIVDELHPTLGNLIGASSTCRCAGHW